jgi:hypothetical protein
VDTGAAAAGRRAVLLPLDADPNIDNRSTRQLVGVMTHGRWIDANERAARWDALPAE